MGRISLCQKIGVKKGAWTPEEDKLLAAYITRYGHWNWNKLPKFAGLTRCGKSCRLRWLNYLKPNIKRGNFTKEEEKIISDMHKLHGNRWSKIASHLEGRTDNDIKNYWHTHLKKTYKNNYIPNVKRSKRIRNEIPKGKINMGSVMILESSSILSICPHTSSDSSSSMSDESKNGSLIPEKIEKQTVIQNNGWDEGSLGIDLYIPDGPLSPVPPFGGQSFPWAFDNEYEMEECYREFLSFTSSYHIWP